MTRKMFPFDDVIMVSHVSLSSYSFCDTFLADYSKTKSHSPIVFLDGLYSENMDMIKYHMYSLERVE